MQVIGLIGGMSWESSAEYYRLLNRGVQARLGGHHSARLVLVNVDFEPIKRAQHDGDWAAATVPLVEAARQLARAGAAFSLLCTNTMHKVFDALEAASPMPFLHLADATGERIRAAGVRRVGLLGTAFTMEQDFYRERLASRFGLDVLVPEADDRACVHRVIYDELCQGEIREDSRAAYAAIIQRLQARGAEAVILGCTEITLLVRPEDSVLPIFDTTRIHCEVALDRALGPEERSGNR
jgi:aspartate racemase